MAKPKVIIITGYGINSEEESAYAFNQTGSEAEIVHINDLIDGHKKLSDYQILCFPGGFSYSDDTGSGNAIANRFRNNLNEEILKFASQDKLIIGICNGFQMITNLGLVPATNGQYGLRQSALMHNITARHECRWIWMKNTSKKCIWTQNIEYIHMPISHGEGNFYCDDTTLQHLKDNDQIAFRYAKPNPIDTNTFPAESPEKEGNVTLSTPDQPTKSSESQKSPGTKPRSETKGPLPQKRHPSFQPANNEYPHNPNGALFDIAGICDESGRIFGLMPHPERFNAFTNEDGWELKKEALIRQNQPIPTKGSGLKIFENAAKYFN